MLLCAHIRLGRTMLRMSQEKLAEITGLSVVTIKRIEKNDDAIERTNFKTVKKIKSTLESHGIEFLYPEGEEGNVGVGIKFRGNDN
ncbi:MAG: helix-turn-helix transcriptional regulator [Proteobacteria bacterium]|nr:helix-turn-helix transcriptional regulator [Pseudomonadota bacterium]